MCNRSVNLRDGLEVYSPQEVKTIEEESDVELVNQIKRFYAAVDSKLPVAGIVKDTAKAAAGYARLNSI